MIKLNKLIIASPSAIYYESPNCLVRLRFQVLLLITRSDIDSSSRCSWLGWLSKLLIWIWSANVWGSGCRHSFCCRMLLLFEYSRYCCGHSIRFRVLRYVFLINGSVSKMPDMMLMVAIWIRTSSSSAYPGVNRTEKKSEPSDSSACPE